MPESTAQQRIEIAAEAMAAHQDIDWRTTKERVRQAFRFTVRPVVEALDAHDHSQIRLKHDAGEYNGCCPLCGAQQTDWNPDEAQHGWETIYGCGDDD